ncbi:putative bzip-type transcription factor [Erysiphe neolycopersici]|uniref:Putative bzip-type transcription factor n=1 Tax=Erysiphe neolycopersici TaxID=212602 RepID=A0A420HZ88_9PEZI|nr:putative bzip-type transcription factor [Erysiphe neolycopersici]
MPSPANSQYATNQAANFSDLGRSQKESGRGSLSLNLGFLKNLKEKTSAKVDGQPPKKRGPKPDSKPALTRRQELNRQAQRTHRERKELYIKSLEQEVLRLKDSFSKISRHKDAIEEENRKLKVLLTQYDIPWSKISGFEDSARNLSSSNLTAGSTCGSYAPRSNSYGISPLNSPLSSNYPSTSPPESTPNIRNICDNQDRKFIDYDQAGIDFVLTYAGPSRTHLERPCMEHMQFLIERASEPGGEPCGHALMASCPPDSYIESHPDSPFRCYHPENFHNGQKCWDITKSDLANLLDLSKKLDLNGEITPVMAWGMILDHPRFHEMKLEDIEAVCQILSGKIKCYGFGAVLEEFEVRDALESIMIDERWGKK